MPQISDREIHPQRLEKGLRPEKALLLAIADMDVQRGSTKKAPTRGTGAGQRVQIRRSG